MCDGKQFEARAWGDGNVSGSSVKRRSHVTGTMGSSGGARGRLNAGVQDSRTVHIGLKFGLGFVSVVTFAVTI